MQHARAIIGHRYAAVRSQGSSSRSRDPITRSTFTVSQLRMPDGDMQIVVWTFAAETINLQVESSERIQEVKRKVQQQSPPAREYTLDQLQLHSSGTQLDDGRTLFESNIQNKAVLILVPVSESPDLDLWHDISQSDLLTEAKKRNNPNLMRFLDALLCEAPEEPPSNYLYYRTVPVAISETDDYIKLILDTAGSGRPNDTSTPIHQSIKPTDPPIHCCMNPPIHRSTAA